MTVIVAIIGLMGGGLVAISGILQARHIKGGTKVSIGITIAVCTLLAFLSLLGLIGAIGRKLFLIRLYFTFLVLHLMFSLGIGIYAIYRIFKESSSFMKDCIAAHPSTVYKNPQGICSQSLKIVKGVTVTLFIVFWLFEIYACVIIKNYSHQLEDEYAVEGVVKDTESW
ncbi:hypothetical protein H0H93_015985 [Arthromyces matolae]|nr:hypothetical protein H0H93_015985 [Arthromyces matolae]